MFVLILCPAALRVLHVKHRNYVVVLLHVLILLLLAMMPKIESDVTKRGV